MSGRASKSTWSIRLIALACVVGLLAGLATAKASAATLPPEGIFDNCRLDTQMPTCVQRLQVMHQGGMQIVAISAANASPASLASYASSAQSLGMSVMWELSAPSWWQDPPTATSMAGTYPGFASACGCNQNGPLLAYLVHWLGQLPGTYGYYAADDSMLSPGDQTGVASYVDQIKQQDPLHTVMIGSAQESQTATYQSIPDVIGTEMYPVTTDPLMPLSANQDTWGSMAQWATDAQHSADVAGKQSAFILQAFTWGDNLSDGQTIGACSASDTQASCYGKLRYPSAAEQLQLRNEVLAHAHPKLILWWSFPGTFGDVTGDTYSIYPGGSEAAARWGGLSAAVQAPFPGSSAPAPASSPTSSAAPRRPQTIGAHLARALRITRAHVAVARKHRHRRRHARRRHRHHKRA
jgi:hypothetical protein